jgi:hypothetical protein
MCFLGAATLVFGTWFYKKEMQVRHDAERGRLREISARYLALGEEERLAREYYPDFISLRDKGVIGQERRLNWIETLQGESTRLRLPDLKYRIEAQTEFIPGYPIETGLFRLYYSPMKLDLYLLHEVDLRRLFQGLNAHAEGSFTPASCRLSILGKNLNSTQGNIRAECELRWFNIRKADGNKVGPS